MENNRRSFLSTGLLSTGWLMGTAHAQHQHTSTQLISKTWNPAKEPKRVRKSFYDLTDQELRNLCRAIGYMRHNMPLEHPCQWDNYARIHALHCTEPNADHPPVHWSWNFLPWHRGYLYFLERILANILTTQFKIDGSKFALPYWDWTAHKEIPNTRERIAKGMPSPFFGYDRRLENMVNDDGLGFDNSALYDGNRGPTLEKPTMNPNNELTQDSKDHVTETLGFMSKQYIELMLTVPFEQFGGKPVTDRQTGQGLLEQGPHNDGHDWVGSRFGKNRTMGTLRTAAGDPMFYMHHGNIDRIWSLYKLPQPDPKGQWGKQKYEFLDVDGSIIIMSVQDIVEQCNNVTYAPSTVDIQAPVTINLSSTSSKKIVIERDMRSRSVIVHPPKDFFQHKRLLLDVQIGTISSTDKYTVKIFAGKKYVGKIKWMDGEHRKHWVKQEMVHTFSVLLQDIPDTANSLILVPPRNGKLILRVKSIEYRPF